MNEYTMLSGYTIQVSPDGQGLLWQTINNSNMVGHIDQLLEIDCEIIDGDNEVDTQVLSNGLLYRWFPAVKEN